MFTGFILHKTIIKLRMSLSKGLGHLNILVPLEPIVYLNYILKTNFLDGVVLWRSE